MNGNGGLNKPTLQTGLELINRFGFPLAVAVVLLFVVLGIIPSKLTDDDRVIIEDQRAIVAMLTDAVRERTAEISLSNRMIEIMTVDCVHRCDVFNDTFRPKCEDECLKLGDVKELEH